MLQYLGPTTVTLTVNLFKMTQNLIDWVWLLKAIGEQWPICQRNFILAVKFEQAERARSTLPETSSLLKALPERSRLLDWQASGFDYYCYFRSAYPPVI